MTSYTNWGSQVPVEIAKGGTAKASHTAYSVLCGGTTATGALQSVASLGTSGQVLTSNGAGALPTWQAGGGSTSGSYYGVLLDSATPTGVSSVEFTSYIDSTYNLYGIRFRNIEKDDAANDHLYITVSTNGGSSYESTNYRWSTSMWGSNFNNSSAQQMRILDVLGTATSSKCNGWIMFEEPSSSTFFKYFWTQGFGGGTDGQDRVFYGEWEGTTAINAIKLAVETGDNYLTGTIELWGFVQP